jgi:DNA invertase Pin-like site-specific DNA recombinase
MSLLGYARVSSGDQNPQLQIDALTAAGCAVHMETGSGARTDRPVLAALLAGMQPGDILVSWKFDRIGRDAWHLLSLVRELEARGCVYRSLTEGLDSSTTFGRFGLQILAAVAEMERATTRERQRAGIAAARRAGRAHGRPQALPPETVEQARSMVGAGSSINRAARALRVPRSTLQRALKA